jgi:hypothetical protein
MHVCFMLRINAYDLNVANMGKDLPGKCLVFRLFNDEDSTT